MRYHVTSLKVAGSVPDEAIRVWFWLIPASRTLVLGPTKSITEYSSRNLPGSTGRSGQKSDKPTAIYELIV